MVPLAREKLCGFRDFPQEDLEGAGVHVLVLGGISGASKKRKTEKTIMCLPFFKEGRNGNIDKITKKTECHKAL